MNLNSVKKSLLLLTIVAISPFATGDNASASKVIAGVLVNFQHFPSATDKTALEAIEGDSSASDSIKMVARAIRNISHSATAADKQQLAAIAATDPAKTLADIVVGINHVPSAEAKSALQAMQ